MVYTNVFAASTSSITTQGNAAADTKQQTDNQANAVPVAAATSTVPPVTATPASQKVKPATPALAASSAAPLPVALPNAPSVSTAARLYVRGASNAANQAAAWSTSRPADAALMTRLASMPVAEWYGDWTANVSSAVNTYVSEAQADGSVPVLVAYNIPERDCGSYSAGGASSASAYAAWIQSFASGIGHRQAIVIVEPDALAGMDCLSASDQVAREASIADAVTRLRNTTNAAVYIDAGNSSYQTASTMATRLKQANIASASGFSLNVSNFYSTSNNVSYGTSISRLTNTTHFVVDTSRNGNGSNGDWCNPSGRAVGNTPTLATGNPLVDGYLWIKRVGESDGSCNGGPAAGTWWPDYALTMLQNAGW